MSERQVREGGLTRRRCRRGEQRPWTRKRSSPTCSRGSTSCKATARVRTPPNAPTTCRGDFNRSLRIRRCARLTRPSLLVSLSRAAFYEQSQLTLKQNKDQVDELRREGKELRNALQSMNKERGGTETSAIHEAELTKVE